MKKAKQLAQIIIDKTNAYTEKYMTKDGKIVHSSTSLSELNDIIVRGFTLDKYLVEGGYIEKYPMLAGICAELQKYINKLNTSEDNAKKLSLDSALQIWQQAKIVIAFLASVVLDLKEDEDDVKKS